MMKTDAPLAFFGKAGPAVFAAPVPTIARGQCEVEKHREEPGSFGKHYSRNVAGDGSRR